jgi:hypothetical protein
MIQVSPSQVTPQIRKLFNPDAPASLRCFAVLDGQSVGRIWADTLSSPKSVVVREAAFGSDLLPKLVPRIMRVPRPRTEQRSALDETTYR